MASSSSMLPGEDRKARLLRVRKEKKEAEANKRIEDEKRAIQAAEDLKVAELQAKADAIKAEKQKALQIFKSEQEAFVADDYKTHYAHGYKIIPASGQDMQCVLDAMAKSLNATNLSFMAPSVETFEKIMAEPDFKDRTNQFVEAAGISVAQRKEFGIDDHHLMIVDQAAHVLWLLGQKFCMDLALVIINVDQPADVLPDETKPFGHTLQRVFTTGKRVSGESSMIQEPTYFPAIVYIRNDNMEKYTADGGAHINHFDGVKAAPPAFGDGITQADTSLPPPQDMVEYQPSKPFIKGHAMSQILYHGVLVPKPRGSDFPGVEGIKINSYGGEVYPHLELGVQVYQKSVNEHGAEEQMPSHSAKVRIFLDKLGKLPNVYNIQISEPVFTKDKKGKVTEAGHFMVDFSTHEPLVYERCHIRQPEWSAETVLAMEALENLGQGRDGRIILRMEFTGLKKMEKVRELIARLSTAHDSMFKAYTLPRGGKANIMWKQHATREKMSEVVYASGCNFEPTEVPKVVTLRSVPDGIVRQGFGLIYEWEIKRGMYEELGKNPNSKLRVCIKGTNLVVADLELPAGVDMQDLDLSDRVAFNIFLARKSGSTKSVSKITAVPYESPYSTTQLGHISLRVLASPGKCLSIASDAVSIDEAEPLLCRAVAMFTDKDLSSTLTALKAFENYGHKFHKAFINGAPKDAEKFDVWMESPLAKSLAAQPESSPEAFAVPQGFDAPDPATFSGEGAGDWNTGEGTGDWNTAGGADNWESEEGAGDWNAEEGAGDWNAEEGAGDRMSEEGADNWNTQEDSQSDDSTVPKMSAIQKGKQKESAFADQEEQAQEFAAENSVGADQPSNEDFVDKAPSEKVPLDTDAIRAKIEELTQEVMTKLHLSKDQVKGLMSSRIVLDRLLCIWGPPGTGKTYFACAKSLLKVKLGYKVLYIAPSNPAAHRGYVQTKKHLAELGNTTTKVVYVARKSEEQVVLRSYASDERPDRQLNEKEQENKRVWEALETKFSAEIEDVMRFRDAQQKQAMPDVEASLTQQVIENVLGNMAPIIVHKPGSKKADNETIDAAEELRKGLERLKTDNFYDFEPEDKKLFNKAFNHAQAKIIEDADMIFCTPITVRGTIVKTFASGKDDRVYLVIDEGSTIPDATWISCVSAPEFAPKIVACDIYGDHKQNGFLVTSKNSKKNEFAASLAFSFFERKMLNMSYGDYIMLTTVFRYNDEIAEFPNEECYDNRMVTTKEANAQTIHESKLAVDREYFEIEDEKQLHTVIIDVRSTEEYRDQDMQGSECVTSERTKSRSNPFNANVIADYWLKVLIGTKHDPTFNASEDAAIIAMYKEQVMLIKRALAAKITKYNASIGVDEQISRDDLPQVATVDSFQGLDALYVMVCCTISSGKEPSHVGFLIESNRINTAVTRPKIQLIFVVRTELINDKWLHDKKVSVYDETIGANLVKPTPYLAGYINHLLQKGSFVSVVPTVTSADLQYYAKWLGHIEDKFLPVANRGSAHVAASDAAWEVNSDDLSVSSGNLTMEEMAQGFYPVPGDEGSEFNDVSAVLDANLAHIQPPQVEDDLSVLLRHQADLESREDTERQTDLSEIAAEQKKADKFQRAVVRKQAELMKEATKVDEFEATLKRSAQEHKDAEDSALKDALKQSAEEHLTSVAGPSSDHGTLAKARELHEQNNGLTENGLSGNTILPEGPEEESQPHSQLKVEDKDQVKFEQEDSGASTSAPLDTFHNAVEKQPDAKPGRSIPFSFPGFSDLRDLLPKSALAPPALSFSREVPAHTPLLTSSSSAVPKVKERDNSSVLEDFDAALKSAGGNEADLASEGIMGYIPEYESPEAEESSEDGRSM